jgi:maltose O-acetyltransferase
MLRKALALFLGRFRRKTLARLLDGGLRVGERLHVGQGVLIDGNAPWLIELGSDVTLSPNVHILAHDASSKLRTGYTRLAQTRIGDRVFVGARTIVLPGVTIGDDCVIAAGSVVVSDIPPGSVAVGAPARVVSSMEEWTARESVRRSGMPTFEATARELTELAGPRRDECREKIRQAGGGYCR